MTTLIAVDPGETIGVAAAKLKPYRPLLLDQFPRAKLPDLLDLIKKLKPRMLIVEQFRVYPHKSKELSWRVLVAPEVIGTLEQFCAANRGVNICCQSPVLRGTIKDKALRTFGFGGEPFDFKGKPHAKDAAQHLLAYMLRVHEKEFIEVVRDVALRERPST